MVQRLKVKVTRQINAHTVNAQYLPNEKAYSFIALSISVANSFTIMISIQYGNSASTLPKIYRPTCVLLCVDGNAQLLLCVFVCHLQ